MDVLATITSMIALVASAVAAWFGLFSLRTAQRSVPEEMVKHIGALRVETAETSGKMDEYASKIIGWRAELENVLEQVEGVLESVERKRKSTAAAASRVGNSGPAEDDPSRMSIGQLEQLARSRGLMSV